MEVASTSPFTPNKPASILRTQSRTPSISVLYLPSLLGISRNIATTRDDMDPYAPTPREIMEAAIADAVAEVVADAAAELVADVAVDLATDPIRDVSRRESQILATYVGDVPYILQRPLPLEASEAVAIDLKAEFLRHASEGFLRWFISPPPHDPENRMLKIIRYSFDIFCEVEALNPRRVEQSGLSAVVGDSQFIVTDQAS